jgi:hypothetical protein
MRIDGRRLLGERMSVRLRHSTYRNVNFTVIHHRRYTVPMLCPVCGELHVFKTYHLRLDAQGETVVSDVIWERLAELEKLPLRKVGKEAHPQPQSLTVGPGLAAPPPETLREPTIGFVPPSMKVAVEEANQIIASLNGGPS